MEIKFTNKNYHNLKTKLKTNQININKDIDIIDKMKFLGTKMLNIYLTSLFLRISFYL